jgi:hypothetical protein
MYIKPKDIPGNCNARLYIGDDCGDGRATMICGLEKNHEGLHKEEYQSCCGGMVTVTWEYDEREEEE